MSDTPAASLPEPSDESPPRIGQQTLAAWRAELARIRTSERQQSRVIPVETGRLLEIVGQVLAQGGGSLPPDDIACIEHVTGIDVTYQKKDS